MSAWLCRECHKRPARSSYKGRVAYRRDHDLCRQCWRSMMDRALARQKDLNAAGDDGDGLTSDREDGQLTRRNDQAKS